MAQHAKPKLSGQSDDLRAQFTASSSFVKTNSSKLAVGGDGIILNPLS
jgi:hypothetical protein